MARQGDRATKRARAAGRASTAEPNGAEEGRATPGRPAHDGTGAERVAAERRRWERATLEPTIAHSPERLARFVTTSGLPIERLYTPADLPDFDYLRDLGFPGEPPFTRGVHPTMHRGRLWTMRLFSGFGDAEDTNQRYKYLLAQGQTGLSVAFDFATLVGYDSDHPIGRPEFGKCGVAVSSLRDMELLFDGIPLDQVTTSMTINGPAAIIWAMYIVAAEKQGLPMHLLGGTIQNDVLKEYTAQNTYIIPPRPGLKLVVDTIEFGAQHLPRWNPVSISGYHIREAGSTAIQELAFTLADGFTYVEACIARGLDVDSFAPRLSYFFNAHSDFFEEIAKYRAARRIWAHELKHTYGAESERSLWLRFHTQTAGCALTAQQPEVNVVRVALQALAGVLGGTQSLHTNAMDEALALPTEKTARIALRTQQVIAHESGVVNTVDPLGGSYFVEALTNRMEDGARAYFARIRELGGVIRAIESGYIQREIADAAMRYQREIDDSERIIVGVNAYAIEEPPDVPLLRVSEESERRQIERLTQVRRERDNEALRRRLGDLRAAARRDLQDGPNLMPYIVEAVREYGTLGEIADVLREVYGEYREQIIV
ncbi:MAG: methylmalonyl-CoA mutase family protein [Chloroflexi bacterium]|nr:methylmalonyl-CoA mutase family protein [Chloroflexota bacterium]